MRNKAFFYCVFFFFYGLTTLSCIYAKTGIHNLRCEYLDNPLSIENKTPLLSWQLQSNQSSAYQKFYQIIVASDPSLLTEQKADYWNSGKIESTQSVQIAYGGKALQSRQTLYWKVRIWDKEGKVSGWSAPAQWTMGLLEPSDWKASWIALRTDTFPESTKTYPAPYFRKEFRTDKKIKQATVYVSGLGFYELYLNGRRVGDEVFTPAVTNYDIRPLKKIIYHYDDQSTQRVLYNTYKVKNLLKKGGNSIGVILGNGWYNQRDRTVEGQMWYDTPRLLFQMELIYEDGSTETINSDETWKTSDGPLLHDGIFSGEKYDARLELNGWERFGYDDSVWLNALLVRAPTGKLCSQLAPPERITRTLIPDYTEQKNDSTHLYTLPEVVSGWAELKVKGSKGDVVRMRFIGEEGHDFGQADEYTLKGEGTEYWEPRFTWHTFRYIEVVSRNVTFDKKSLIVKVVHTNPETRGSFHCSNELFNKIYQAYIRTQKANFHGSISSDCPHRERLAYTGDAQVIAESSLLSFDMTQFYRKWLDDMDDARNKKTGYVPHTAPFGGGGGGPAWGSAYVILPWAYYCYYGDTDILMQHYEGMKQWVAYLGTRTDDKGLVVREEPNGWCLGDWCTPGNVEIPEPLVNTAYYFHTADLMKQIANILGEKEDCLHFDALTKQIKENFNAAFFHTETNHYWEGRQGADIFPLAFGLVSDENRENVFNALVAHLENIGYRFDTGILGTPLLLQVLSENGRADLAFKLMNQKEVPSFGYLMDNRFTGLWENWEGHSSRCHPMFGSVVAWFYKYLGGIQVDKEHPGMKQVRIAPQVVGDLHSCKTSFKSLYGLIRSEWEIKNGKFLLTVEVPANCTASITLPNGNKHDNIESGTHHFVVAWKEDIIN